MLPQKILLMLFVVMLLHLFLRHLCLLFFLLEAIRGRPVSVALRERAQQIGVILMVLLMLLVLVMDLQKLFGDG